MKRVDSVLEYARNTDHLYFHVGKATVDGGLKCPICYNIFQNPVIAVPCGHSFCNKCLCRWKHTNAHCPICRQSIECNIQNHSLAFLVHSLQNSAYQAIPKKSKTCLLERRPLFESEKKAKSNFQRHRELIKDAIGPDQLFANNSYIDHAFQQVDQDIHRRHCFPIYQSDEELPQRDVQFRGLTSDSQSETYSYY